MSSILKALKKLEQEKTSRKPDSFRIDAEILRGASRRSYFSSGVFLAAVALFLCGVGATYVFMKRHEVPMAVPPSQTPTTETNAGTPAVTGRSPESVKQGAAESVPHEKPGVKTEPDRFPAPSLRTKPAQQQLQPQKPIEAGAQPDSKPVPPPVTPPTVVTTPGPAVLKVHGIAFQDGSAGGVAVVNGVAVSKGSVVEGARVEEIQADRVKFSRGGEMFEIFLDKSN